jgi:hypothetical protein
MFIAEVAQLKASVGAMAGAMRAKGGSCFRGWGTNFCVEIPRDKEGISRAEYGDKGFQVGAIGGIVFR